MDAITASHRSDRRRRGMRCVVFRSGVIVMINEVEEPARRRRRGSGFYRGVRCEEREASDEAARHAPRSGACTFSYFELTYDLLFRRLRDAGLTSAFTNVDESHFW
jgi:hypothetical protein